MMRQTDDRVHILEPLLCDEFRTTANWHCEGEGPRLWTDNGWLYCDSRAGDIHAATIWCTVAEFADPLWIEFDVRFLDGMFNANLILQARAADGGDVLRSSAGRKGDYDEYHVFPNYIVTFLNDQDTTRVRYRRNPDFALLGETFYKPALQLDRAYHVVVILRNGHVELRIDGAKRYEGLDPSPLTAGRFALRTWKTYLGWSNLGIYRIAKG